MNLQGFKNELIKSYNKQFRIGLVLFLMCAAVCALIIVFVGINNRGAIAGLCIFGLFVLIGLFMMISSIITKGKIKSDQHEILVAINNRTDAIAWVYQHVMTTQHELSNKKHKNHIVVAYKLDGKAHRFMLKEETQVHEMISFLAEQFPRALVGFSEENREAASKVIGKEIKNSTL
ncbi:MAG: hypothetical protein P8Q14_02365 [Vicingaceae bacterium]|nr:hypothetical protein [Vicingaceae bacterium]